MINADVIFRKFKKNGNIVAVLLEFPTEISGDYCKGFFSDLQFKSVNYRSLVSSTVLAVPEEYNFLFDELSRLGYCLNVLTKQSYAYYKSIRLEKIQKELG